MKLPLQWLSKRQCPRNRGSSQLGLVSEILGLLGLQRMQARYVDPSLVAELPRDRLFWGKFRGALIPFHGSK